MIKRHVWYFTKDTPLACTGFWSLTSSRWENFVLRVTSTGFIAAYLYVQRTRLQVMAPNIHTLNSRVRKASENIHINGSKALQYFSLCDPSPASGSAGSWRVGCSQRILELHRYHAWPSLPFPWEETQTHMQKSPLIPFVLKLWLINCCGGYPQNTLLAIYSQNHHEV